MLPLARALACEQCGSNRLCRRQGRDLVRHNRADEPRPFLIGTGLYGGQPRKGLDDRVVRWLLHPGTHLAESADRHIHDIRFGCADLGLADTEPTDHARPEVLHQYVRARGQALQQTHPALGLQIDGDGALVSVDVEERSRHASALVSQRTDMVARGRRLELDDIGPLIAQEHRRPWAGQHAGEVDDAVAMQGAWHEGISCWMRDRRVPRWKSAAIVNPKNRGTISSTGLSSAITSSCLTCPRPKSNLT